MEETMMKIAVACDHGGYELKMKLIPHLKEKGYETITVTGYDDAYGYIAHRDPSGGFWMIYFTALKDGVWIDVCLRNNDNSYTITEANALMQTIVNSEP